MKSYITKTDVIVASICILFVFTSLGGNGSCRRRRLSEQARRVVCLSNLKILLLAWSLYADENDGKIVNGMAGKDREEVGVVTEKAWTGRDWADGYEAGTQLPEHRQEQAIRDGALFKYIVGVTAYSCPGGLPGQMRTYSIVDSMNGVPRPRTREDGVWINKSRQIRKPTRRIVFIDVGRATPESFAVHYDKEQWWASPPVRHGKGTTVSFADGHSDHWEWNASETVKLGKSADSFDINIVPQTPDGKEGLHRLQEAVWGKLGYTPSD